MSAVGIVSISVGALGVFYGGSSLVAPAALLRWFKGTIRTNGRTRIFGAFLLSLGAAMIWAGASEEGSFDVNQQSTLAAILSLIGWAWVVVMTTVVLFPEFYRSFTNAFLPSDPSGSLSGWRLLGLGRVVISVPCIYFGALAL